MKRLILMGRSESGKTTLKQALTGEAVHYHKTQYIHYDDVLIDTPGEYAQTHHLGCALALYAYEADVVGLLAAATESYSLFPPNITCMVNREVIGIVTKINEPKARRELAGLWLRNAGCRRIFYVDAVTGEGVEALLEYLRG
ncbi:MAG: ethanolamine utilization protein EutP [Lachnospiraceae bacterium]|jgi:ethanolamine utilization protein EutP|nr:ethanolamine utilization protein EutP [Lachnospiraceae bacterium]